MLTIVMPTRNRPKLLRTQMDYFRKAGLKHELLLVDGSDDAYFAETEAGLRSWSEGLNVRHLRAVRVDSDFATKRIWTQMIAGLEEVDTPFASVLMDDDFLILEGIERILSTIAGDPRIGMCCGRAIAVSTTGLGADAQVRVETTIFPQTHLPWDDPIIRVVNHVSHFTGTAFAVHRLDILKNAFALIDDLEMPSFLLEVLQSCIAVAQGRLCRVDDLYLVRHTHERSSSVVMDLKKMSLDIFDPAFLDRFLRLAECLKRALKRLAIDIPDDFDEQLKDAFSYLVVQKRLKKQRSLPIDRIAKLDDMADVRKELAARQGPVWERVAPVLGGILRNCRDGLIDEATARQGI